jgi:hypothetical protein
MRDFVVAFRKKVEMRFLNFNAGVVHSGQEPLLLWKNLQYARHRRMFDRAQLQVEGEPPAPVSDVPEPGTRSAFGAGRTILVVNKPGDPDLVVPAGQREKYEAAFARFCSVFPDMFYMEQRGRHYFAMRRDTGRYLSAGFHNVVGYFRDDQPLYELILDEKQQRDLDGLWREFDFVASATTRMYSEFALGGTRDADVQTEGEGPEVTLIGDEGYRNDVTSEKRIKQLQAMYLEDAQQGGTAKEIAAVMHYFDWANGVIRWVEKARVEAEASHLEALQDFAQRAYRRPLEPEERNGVIAFYRKARDVDGVDHETAMRESIVSVLMSPDFFYRVDLIPAAGEVSSGVRPISAYDLASRLSYFLWSSMPDAELLARAAAGDLHRPEVIAAQARRMLKDPRVRALAVEFGGNWLDFRQFESMGTVNRERFPSFNDGLRQAMFEEPVRFLQDVFQKDRSVLDLLDANDTFVNRPLAEHYGMPHSGKTPEEWVRIADATPYDRGGLLPMGAFLTKNAPGLRTSPVKRGNWVVKYVLGEKIPAPPPDVPVLPADEKVTDLSLRDMLARHREDPNCAA